MVAQFRLDTMKSLTVAPILFEATNLPNVLFLIRCQKFARCCAVSNRRDKVARGCAVSIRMNKLKLALIRYGTPSNGLQKAPLLR